MRQIQNAAINLAFAASNRFFQLQYFCSSHDYFIPQLFFTTMSVPTFTFQTTVSFTQIRHNLLKLNALVHQVIGYTLQACHLHLRCSQPLCIYLQITTAFNFPQTMQ